MTIAIEILKQVFVPGENVIGRVRVFHTAPVQIAGIEARFRGLEEGAVKVGGFFKKTYSNQFIIIDQIHPLAGPQTLPAGEMVFEFAQPLPGNALPTYYGTNVKITYYIEGIIRYGKKEEKAVVAFWVKRDGRIITIAPKGTRYAYPTGSPSPLYFFDLNQSAFFAGTTVNGAITINNMRQMVDFLARKLDIFLVALETTKIFTTKDEIFYDEKIHSQLSFSLAEFPEGVLKPFHLNIPPNAFSSYRGNTSSLRWFVRTDFGCPNPFPQDSNLKNMGQQYEIEIINIA
ncbi:MAG: hypothetical protein QW728_07595 [Thermoplasmata archaeon]